MLSFPTNKGFWWPVFCLEGLFDPKRLLRGWVHFSIVPKSMCLLIDDILHSKHLKHDFYKTTNKWGLIFWHIFLCVWKASEFYGKTLDPASTSSHYGAQPIKFKELQKATKRFHHDMWLGRGAFGHVFKGWIDEHTLRASNSRSGMAVAVKKWRKGIIQHEEYLVYMFVFHQLFEMLLTEIFWDAR